MTKPHIPRWLKIIAVVYAIYLALVLLVATPLLNIYAPKIYREQTGAELKLEHIIWLNPFTLSTKIRKSSGVNADQSPFWSFEEIGINVSIASLWRGHLVLDNLALHGIDVQITQTAPDRFNFADILAHRTTHFPPQPEAPQNAESAKPLAIEIYNLSVAAQHLGYKAPYASEPVDIAIEDLHFTLKNISTLPQSISTQEKTASQKTAATQGTVASALPEPISPRPPILLSGENIEFSAKKLSVNFIREQHPFSTALHDLSITIPAFSTERDSDYSVSVLDANGGSIRINGKAAVAQNTASGQAKLQGISLVPAWQYLADKLATTAEQAQLDGDIKYRVAWGDVFAYQVHDSQLALRDLKLQSRVDAETSVAHEVLRIEGLTVDSTHPSVRITHIALEKPILRGWNRDTKVSLIDMISFPGSDDESPPSPWHVVIDTIDVVDGTVHWRANQLDNRKLTIAPLTLHFANLHWPDAAPLQFNGSGAISGEIGSDQNIDVGFTGEIIPGDTTGKISGRIAHLPLVMGNSFLQKQIRAKVADGFLNTDVSVSFEKAQATRVESAGSIDQFELHATPDNRKLATWKKLEWQQLALDTSKQRVTIKQMIATQPWAQFRINTDGTNNFQQLLVATENTPAIKSDKQLHSSEKKPTAPTDKLWHAAIDTIRIDRAGIDFRDASLASAFRTNITDLSGDISGLDTNAKRAKDQPAKVALKGTVDGYAPVAVTGTFNPFAAQPALNITLDITNLDLATLTPYSGTYAGYRIDGGRLSVQMAYTLENGLIKGTNHIVVNQMQLGERVRGPKVMELPLRLAIYLLTDSNGVMDLGVDVTGDVDDPDFSVGSIIWKALRNVIVKTAASPFKALARLTGSNRDDLDRIEFQAGTDQLAAGEHEKLPAIQRGLEQKTALQLNVMGHVSPSRDIEALRDNSLSAQLIAQGGIKPADIQQQSKNWQREVIKLFKVRFPHDTNALEVMQMNDAMRDNIELAPTALQDLAAQRALAVKQTLVTDHGLSADRVFVKPTDLGADKTPGAFVTFAVE